VSTPTRRRPGEAREAIVVAARDAFARHGYQGTTLRLVAKQAEVNEALIFRNFGSKEQLFTETVVDPFRTFVDELLHRWQHRETPLDNRALVELFVGDLYDFAREHREIFFALANAEHFGGTDGLTGALAAQVQRIVQASVVESGTRGLDFADFEIVVPGVMAMIFGAVLFDPWLFPASGKRPPDADIRRWMAEHAYRAIDRD
jgi:AcrR family transcriptional regulator